MPVISDMPELKREREWEKGILLLLTHGSLIERESMSHSESPDSSESGALGFYAVLMRVHEPLLESIFWLALGCVLGWQDEECIMRMNEKDD